MRRRRRNNGAWFPVLPTVYGEGERGVTFDQVSFYGSDTGGIPAGSRIGIQAVPLTLDETITPDIASGSTGASLRDIVEGQDCIIDRVVGKVAVSVSTVGSLDLIQRCIAGAALAILPVDETSQETPDLTFDEYDPFIADNSQAPWMWRRMWWLGNGYNFGILPNSAVFPPNNVQGYGDRDSGPHLDTKGVKRRITKEQRLFIVFAAYTLNDISDSPGQGNNSVTFFYDVRIHGAMRKAHNRSTFK